MGSGRGQAKRVNNQSSNSSPLLTANLYGKSEVAVFKRNDNFATAALNHTSGYFTQDDFENMMEDLKTIFNIPYADGRFGHNDPIMEMDFKTDLSAPEVEKIIVDNFGFTPRPIKDPEFEFSFGDFAGDDEVGLFVFGPDGEPGIEDEYILKQIFEKLKLKTYPAMEGAFDISDISIEDVKKLLDAEPGFTYNSEWNTIEDLEFEEFPDGKINNLFNKTPDLPDVNF